MDSVEIFGDRLERTKLYVQRGDSYAQEHFSLFPNLSSISLEIGASFLIDFSLSLTWNRPTHASGALPEYPLLASVEDMESEEEQAGEPEQSPDPAAIDHPDILKTSYPKLAKENGADVQAHEVGFESCWEIWGIEKCSDGPAKLIASFYGPEGLEDAFREKDRLWSEGFREITLRKPSIMESRKNGPNHS